MIVLTRLLMIVDFTLLHNRPHGLEATNQALQEFSLPLAAIGWLNVVCHLMDSGHKCSPRLLG